MLKYNIKFTHEGNWKLSDVPNFAVIRMNEEYDKYMSKLKGDSPFVFMRFGDGEKMLIKGEKILSQEGWKAPGHLTKLGRDLLSCLEMNDDNIIFGISCPCCSSADYYWYMSRVKSRQITFANLWINSNYRRFKKDFEELKRDAVVVCNKDGAGKKFGKLNILKQYLIDDDGVGFWEDKGDEFTERICEETKNMKNVLFVFSAGPLSEPIIKRLYESNPYNSYVDFGSAINYLIHDGLTRPFQNDKSEYANRNCWMPDPNQTSFDVSVVLNSYKRPDTLEQQLDAVKNQNLLPSAIYLNQDGINSYYTVDLKKSILDKFTATNICHENVGVWGRFEYAAAVVKTKYVCLLDDDTIPGEGWLENCHMHMLDIPAVYGTNGILVDSDKRYPSSGLSIGWKNPNIDPVQVDFVGHAWFLKTEWLKEMMKGHKYYKDKYKYAGEDMYLSYACQRIGVPTVVPSHNFAMGFMWGSLPKYGYSYGTQQTGVSLSTDNLHKMNAVMIELVNKGWSLICDSSEDTYLEIKTKYGNGNSVKDRIIKGFLDNWVDGRKVYFYGAGKFSEVMTRFADSRGKEISGYIVSSLKGNENKNKVITLEDFKSLGESANVVLALSDMYQAEVREELKNINNVSVYPQNDMFTMAQIVGVLGTYL